MQPLLNVREKFIMRMRVRSQCSENFHASFTQAIYFRSFRMPKKAGKARFRTIDKKLFSPKRENSPFYK